MIILLVLRIKLVEHLAVGDELLLMVLEREDNLRNVFLNLVVLGAELSDAVSGFFEQTEETALLALVHVKALQLGDEVGQHIGNRAGVLGLHVLQNLVGELGNLRLRGESYYDDYRDIVDRGHTLGLHSYTHDYDKIYASLADFSEDIEELRNLLYDVTGVNCVYYRFPGGSSNTVSRVDMNTLIDYVNAEGLIYYDWNALNNDAVCGSYTPEQLVDNIMKDALQHDDVVILMHDLESRHTTVESLPMLIERLRDDGYELLPIDENAPLIRHR